MVITYFSVMKFGGTPKRSIRYGVFVGVLASSLFAGSGAFADSLTQANFYSTISANLSGTYILGENIDISTANNGSSPTGATVFGSFTGTLDGANNTITGLTKPLFDYIGGTVSDLDLQAAELLGVTGQGILSNSTGTESLITNVSAQGDVTSNLNDVGGLVGDSQGTITGSSTSGTIVSTGSYVGGIAGRSSGVIENSTSSMSVNSSQNYVGGVVGYTTGELSNSQATGSVTTSGFGVAGGLVGYADGNSNGVTITNSHASGLVQGGNQIGGLIGLASVNVTIIESSASGAVSGAAKVGGLVGQSAAAITNSYATGTVEASGSYTGGLVGYSSGNISDSHARLIGGISSNGYNVGGLIGYAEGAVSNSYAVINNGVTGAGSVGGLIGTSEGSTSNSYAIIQNGVSGYGTVGGLIGYTASDTSNSYAIINGGVTGLASYVGGLIGYTQGALSNSYASVTGGVSGDSAIGGLIGYMASGSLDDSYSRIEDGVSANYGDVGGLVGANYGRVNRSYTVVNDGISGICNVGGLVGFAGNSILDSYGIVTGGISGGANTAGDRYDDSVTISNTYLSLDELEHSVPLVAVELAGQLGDAFSKTPGLNFGQPYLVNLLCSYENACTTEDSGDGGDPTPSPSERPIRERVEREVREVAESRAPEKIEKSVGFKNETPLPKSAPIAFVTSTEKIDLAKVKAVEIAPTVNVKVVTKAGEALQISLNSESKEPVELWVKSPDGSWLLAGVITFDKDGKAILPPLQFKNAGDYSLVLSKPSAGSAKGSAPLNQTGSLLVVVS